MESIELLRILDEIKSLSAKLDAIEIKKSVISEPHRSKDLNELFSAMAKAQAEMKIAGTDSENPYFKSRYADLATLVRASRPSLTKFGLSVIQQVLPNDDGQMILHTILGHSSGQYIETRMRILPVKNDIQSFGSYITYLRRYSYAAIIGCVASGDDDDGEAAMVASRDVMAKGVALNSKYHPKEESQETITKEQMDEAEYELGEYPDILDQVLDGLKIQSLADMPKSKYQASMKRIREIKNMRNGIK
jgi:hypothetical protein